MHAQGGEATYAGDFTVQHLQSVLYPDALTPDIQVVLGSLVLLVNLAIYGWLARMIHDGSSPFDLLRVPEPSRGTKACRRFLLSVSQLTDHPSAIDYSFVMRQIDFYFHDGCLSQQSVLLLTKELQQHCPAWQISVHPLLEHEAKTLGFQILPTTVINGRAVAGGIPTIGWLLKRMKECE